MPTLSSTDATHGLNAARFNGHIPVTILVPATYDHPSRLDGVCIELGDVDEPTIVTVEGARLNMKGHAINE